MKKITEQLKSLGSYLLSMAIMIAIIAIPAFFIFGGLWLAEILLPILFIVMWLIFVIDIFILLPLAIFKKSRSISGIGFFISSYIYGLTLWLWAFLLTYVIWGMMAVIIGLFIFGVGVVPIALLASLVDGQWSIVIQLLILIGFTYSSRVIGIYLLEKA